MADWYVLRVTQTRLATSNHFWPYCWRMSYSTCTSCPNCKGNCGQDCKCTSCSVSQRSSPTLTLDLDKKLIWLWSTKRSVSNGDRKDSSSVRASRLSFRKEASKYYTSDSFVPVYVNQCCWPCGAFGFCPEILLVNVRAKTWPLPRHKYEDRQEIENQSDPRAMSKLRVRWSLKFA